jgi:glycosyltransferase involved in cell wall biosynthesis
MKIVYLINGFADGGAELGLATIVEHGFFRGHDVKLCGLVRDRGSVAYARLRAVMGSSVKVFSDAAALRPKHLLFGMAHLFRVLRAERPDLLVLSLPQADLVGRLTSIAFPKVRVVSFFHVAKFNCGLANALLRATSFCVDAVLYDHPETLEAMEALFPLSMKPAAYAPLTVLDPAPNPAPDAPAEAPRLLAMGRLVDEKNHAELVQAVRLLHEQGRPVRLAIAGEGPLRSQLEALIQRLHLQPFVELKGFVKDTATLRRGHDVFIQPSKSEGLCIAVLEAMAAGMPVVATDIGGIRRYGMDGHNMIKSASPNREDLADAIRRALAADRLALCRNALKTVRENYGIKVVQGQWRQALQKIASLPQRI